MPRLVRRCRDSFDDAATRSTMPRLVRRCRDSFDDCHYSSAFPPEHHGLPPLALRGDGDTRLLPIQLLRCCDSFDDCHYSSAYAPKQYADTYWEVLVRTLDEYYPPFLSETDQLVKTDEMGYGDYAFLPRSGPVTYYNALYVHALKYSAQLAENLGHSEDAERWTTRAASVGAALVDKNFDTSVGAFYDGGPCPGEAAGTVCNVHAQDGNSIAILAGITNDTISTGILQYWAQTASQPYGNAFYDSTVLSPSDRFDERVYAFISYFELAARLATPGAAESGFEEIRRLYGWMATHDPEITMWEGIGPDGGTYSEGFTSMAHGWSTGIVPLLSNYVLGVTPLGPGFNKWQVCPLVDGGDLTWARGVVPTPNGDITVSWEKKKHDFTLKVTAPEGTDGSICIPVIDFASSKVKLNGKSIERNDGDAHIKLAGGEHVLTLEA